MAAANERQRIDTSNLTSSDDITGLLAVFDAALAAQRRIRAEQDKLRDFAKATLGTFVHAPSTERMGLMADSQPLAECALRLWCSANQIDFLVDDYIHQAERWHVVAACIDGQRFVTVQHSWPLETEPRIVTDADQMWRPAP